MRANHHEQGLIRDVHVFVALMLLYAWVVFSIIG